MKTPPLCKNLASMFEELDTIDYELMHAEDLGTDEE